MESAVNIHALINSETTPPHARFLDLLISTRMATVGVVGLGYVGLPLAVTIAGAGFRVIGLDTDQSRVDAINQGHSGIGAVPDDKLRELVGAGTVRASASPEAYGDCDIICICVPTPLSRQREPDLSYIESAMRSIAKHLRRDQLIILESTTFPGTTDEVVKPILETSGLTAGKDFYIGYSPEREDPGNPVYTTANIPKVVSGDGAAAQQMVEAFYNTFIETIVPVSSIRTAEVVKITENVFRCVNIALINELKLIYTAMGIDIWEVIAAASTKPFGFMPFYPGPGLGGHCIPVDPFYLTWKSRELELPTRFIELAGEINQSMPKYVVTRLEEALDKHFGLAPSQAAVLVVGAAYKKNIGDVRESPSLRILESLAKRVGRLSYHDPFVPSLKLHLEKESMVLNSVELTGTSAATYDAIVILADHDSVDYRSLATQARLIVDTRNAIRSRGLNSKRLILA